MTQRLSEASRRMLVEAGFSEIADDMIVIGTTDIRVLLSHRAVADLNAQARERNDIED